MCCKVYRGVESIKKPLLDVIFASDKRKNTLLLLQDGPKEMEVILNHLETTRQALLPQIRILEDHYLVTNSDDKYELTAVGELILSEMHRLLNTIEVFDENTDYWWSHNIEFIPPHLLKRIGELGKCKEVKLALAESYQLNQETVETTLKSKSFNVVTSFFHPNYPAVFSEMASKNVNISVIVCKAVLEKMQIDHQEHFQQLLDTDFFNLFVYDNEMGFQVIAYNDYILLMRLLTEKGDIDVNHILCPNSSALEWSKELFEYYLKDSIPVTDLSKIYV